MMTEKLMQLGNLQLPSKVFYAPLAGCSDYPYRKMSAKYRPGLMYCEMVKMEALIRFNSATFRLLDYSEEMHPIGGQLCGSNPSIAGQAARMIEELGFDVVDLNCGCPVDKITKDGSGSGLLKTPERIGEIISNMVAAVKIPVTLKIRAGWDQKTINGAQIVKIAEQAGAQAICVHGRTREQAYRGPANWEYIKACKEAATTIKVIANGDIIDGPSAAKAFADTGCDAVLVARGTMGQPWIVEDILHYLNGQLPLSRSLEDCRQELIEHFMWVQQYYKEDHRICLEMRRVGCWYLKKSKGTRKFRELISRVDNAELARELILHFPIGEEKEEEEEKISETECCI